MSAAHKTPFDPDEFSKEPISLMSVLRTVFSEVARFPQFSDQTKCKFRNGIWVQTTKTIGEGNKSLNSKSGIWVFGILRASRFQSVSSSELSVHVCHFDHRIHHHVLLDLRIVEMGRLPKIRFSAWILGKWALRKFIRVERSFMDGWYLSLQTHCFTCRFE